MFIVGALTEKAYYMLKKMAEAHTKLCMRKHVESQDILAAISICEKFIKKFFNTDLYSSPNELKATSIEYYDAYMNELSKWYNDFTNYVLKKK